MICLRYEIQAKSRSDKFIIIPLGDIHLGFAGVDEKKLDGFISYIEKTPNIYWLGMGDYIEAINLSDIRFDPASLPKWCREHLDDLPKTQADYFIDKVSRISHRCIGLLSGNHEDVIRRKYHNDIHSYICTALGVSNLSSTTMISLVFQNRRSTGTPARIVHCFAMHGYGGCRTESASMNKILNKGKEFNAEIYLVGHDHFLIAQRKVQIGSTGGKHPVAIDYPKIFAVTGTFRLTYHDTEKSDWAERMGYPPTRTGAHKITVIPFRHTEKNGREVVLAPDLHISE